MAQDGCQELIERLLKLELVLFLTYQINPGLYSAVGSIGFPSSSSALDSLKTVKNDEARMNRIDKAIWLPGHVL